MVSKVLQCLECGTKTRYSITLGDEQKELEYIEGMKKLGCYYCNSKNDLVEANDENKLVKTLSRSA